MFKLFFILNFYFLFTLCAACEKTVAEQLSFQTTRTVVRPLQSAEIEKIKDCSAVEIFESEENLTNYRKIFERTDIDILKEFECIIYYGIFLPDTITSIGTIKMQLVRIQREEYFFVYDLAHYNEDYRNKGYGTEVKSGLFDHYKHLHLIPSDPRELAWSMGFYGSVAIINKGSLKYNQKSGCKFSLELGSIGCYYPYFFQLDDDKASPNEHEQITVLLTNFLSADQEISKKGEKALRKAMLDKIMKLDEDKFQEVLAFHGVSFFESTLNTFPDLRDSINHDKLQWIRQISEAGDDGLDGGHATIGGY